MIGSVDTSEFLVSLAASLGLVLNLGLLGIDWGIDPKAAILSDKDAKAPFLKDFVSPFVYEG